MTYYKTNEGFSVEVVKNGTKNNTGDRVYSYNIISNKSFDEVKKYCMEILKPCFKKTDKPNPFSPELVEFTKKTNLNNGMGEMYYFEVLKGRTS